MQNLVYEVNNLQGLLVKVGLAQPRSRAFLAFTTTALIAYAVGYPKATFAKKDDKNISPAEMFFHIDMSSPTNNFLTLPVTAAAIAYVFT